MEPGSLTAVPSRSTGYRHRWEVQETQYQRDHSLATAEAYRDEEMQHCWKTDELLVRRETTAEDMLEDERPKMCCYCLSVENTPHITLNIWCHELFVIFGLVCVVFAVISRTDTLYNIIHVYIWSYDHKMPINNTTTTTTTTTITTTTHCKSTQLIFTTKSYILMCTASASVVKINDENVNYTDSKRLTN